MKTKLAMIALAIIAAGLLGAIAITAQGPQPESPQAAFGSTFTYQGQLKKNNSLVNDFCNLTFSLWDAQSSGNQVGGNHLVTGVTIVNGRFTVQVNSGNEFGGNSFKGEARWLQIDTQCASDGGGIVTLTRQPITAAPYSIFALSAGTATTATSALTATFAYSATSSVVQARVTGNCAVGSSVRVVNADGSVTCNAPVTQYSPLYQPEMLDLTLSDAGLKGFMGGFTDGRYGYLSPYSTGAPSGKIARFDLQDFTSGGVTSLDLAAVDSGLTGFLSGFSDGHYGYFVPYYNGATHGKLARVDLLNFTVTGVLTLDLTTVDPSLKGFEGGFTDGRYGYLVPQTFGKIARVDLQNFTSGGVSALDLTIVDPALTGFQGGFTDGQFGYFVPNGYPTSNGKLVRVDFQNFSTGGVAILDLTLVDSTLKGFVGGFTDGRYGYLVPNYYVDTYHGKVTRIDLHNFTPSGVTILDLGAIDPALKGFWGGFTDGRYGYFVPWSQAASIYSSKVARVDLQNFTTSGVTVRDLSATNPTLKGFRGGFTDGRYGYFVPFQQPQAFGRVARIQLFFGGSSP